MSRMVSFGGKSFQVGKQLVFMRAPGSGRWWRAPAYSIPAFNGGGDLLPSLIADFRRRRYALPMGMTPAQILAATPAEIAAAMRACTFSDMFEFSRLSAATGTVGGQLVTVSVDQPRLEDGGLLLEGAATNKVRCQKSNPTVLTNANKGGDANATLTLVNDAAELAAAGLSDVCTNGMVYKLDNSAGTGSAWVTIAGMSGNTNQHALSAYVRGGAGRVELSGGASGGLNFVASPQYRRVGIALTPVDATRLFSISTPAGQTIYFILPQLEEGAFATSVIPGDALSATARVADSCKLTARAAAVLQRASAGVLVQGSRLARAVATTASQIIGGIGGNRLCGTSTSGVPMIGATQAITIGNAPVEPWPDFGFAVGWDANGKAGAVYAASRADAVPMDADLTSVYLGRSASGTNANCYYHQLVVWPARPANAALTGKATAYA